MKHLCEFYKSLLTKIIANPDKLESYKILFFNSANFSSDICMTYNEFKHFVRKTLLEEFEEAIDLCSISGICLSLDQIRDDLCTNETKLENIVNLMMKCTCNRYSL